MSNQVETPTVQFDDVHVSQKEAEDAVNPNVGEGDPLTAPDFPEPSDDDWDLIEHGKLPTNKFISALITALVLYIITKLAIPIDATIEQAINVFIPFVVAYFIPNHDTPGGVPDAS